MITSSRFTPSSLDAIPAMKPLRPSKELSAMIEAPPGLRGFVVSILNKGMDHSDILELPSKPGNK
jgi:hypothetical protein